ncbi:single-stranded-DNA-specific exonuclease RecJ [Aliidiomarina taiwanensis]|uniref:Single-stranded-DNA-specific exonuclease RecJ n=1 Tax=Aliidiomarina taiwanensis TaxID=946228 RepID=A0A432XAA0_9GAMM|nr:single-stranded-DNA-specific exonuclease RecJ [Aliidiomarina taiwanensis]RUO44342.1 single-stranded-DNA-specific exonuclease RecJ [Aliidiomarina taiwanensis]
MTTHVRLKRRPDAGIEGLPQHLPLPLRHILARRGVLQASELDLQLRGLLHFNTLKDAEKSAARIGQAILADESICIVGDFDADGATSVALFMRALTAMGARRVHFMVPNRFHDGYGLSPELVKLAHAEQTNLIITVDNGVSSFTAVEEANRLGIDVIITDHHLTADRLPEAYAMVNPNQPACSFASKALAGVGVTFYVLMALRAWFRDQQSNHPAAQVNLAQWLDLVAVGTVADVVPLDYNNRILVQQGVARIRQGLCIPGITALLQVAQREPAQIQARDLGFTVGPRINAAGRLDDMQKGIDCLLANDATEAREHALRLDELNRSRRTIEQSMQQDAESLLAKFELDADSFPNILAVYEPDWHQGVIGILAGRLKERFHRPVIAFADAGDNLLKGSARSIPGLHIRDLLERVHTLAPECIERFGGHAMAAGLSVPKDKFELFQEHVQRIANEWIEPHLLERIIWSDGALAPADFNLQLVHALNNAGPWGQKFEEPVFDGLFRVVQHRWLKDVHLKLVLEVEGSTQLVDAIAFHVPNAGWQFPNTEWVQLAFRLQENTFRGESKLQLMIEHIWPA